MTDTGAAEEEPAYHLLLEPDETAVARTALNLLITDEAHQPDIRRIAREALALLDGAPGADGRLTIALESKQMKILHTACRLLFDDLQREQADERELLRAVLDKLPDEHVMRAILI